MQTFGPAIASGIDGVTMINTCKWQRIVIFIYFSNSRYLLRLKREDQTPQPFLCNRFFFHTLLNSTLLSTFVIFSKHNENLQYPSSHSSVINLLLTAITADIRNILSFFVSKIHTCKETLLYIGKIGQQTLWPSFVRLRLSCNSLIIHAPRDHVNCCVFITVRWNWSL